MTELLTGAGMRAIEKAAIDSGAVTGLELMERAGQGVVDAVLAEWPELAKGPHSAVVLCGPGNNGGDGFVVARLLKERGWTVDTFLYGDAGKLPPDARKNHDLWADGQAVHALGGVGAIMQALDEGIAPDLVVDALFGIGLTRPIHGLDTPLRQVSDMAGRRNSGGTVAGCRIVAVDVPSGLCADSGRIICAGPGAAAPGVGAVRSGLTVTFHRAKIGHVIGDGPACCGKVVVTDIGL